MCFQCWRSDSGGSFDMPLIVMELKQDLRPPDWLKSSEVGLEELHQRLVDGFIVLVLGHQLLHRSHIHLKCESGGFSPWESWHHITFDASPSKTKVMDRQTSNHRSRLSVWVCIAASEDSVKNIMTSSAVSQYQILTVLQQSEQGPHGVTASLLSDWSTSERLVLEDSRQSQAYPIRVKLRSLNPPLWQF